MPQEEESDRPLWSEKAIAFWGSQLARLGMRVRQGWSKQFNLSQRGSQRVRARDTKLNQPRSTDLVLGAINPNDYSRHAHRDLFAPQQIVL